MGCDGQTIALERGPRTTARKRPWTTQAIERGRREETGLPVIRPAGIAWTGGLRGEPLHLRLTFENPSDKPTRVTPAQVRYADFGAFLPWRPLTIVAVPPIPPRGTRMVTASVPTPRPRRTPRSVPLEALTPEQIREARARILNALRLTSTSAGPVTSTSAELRGLSHLFDPDAAVSLVANIEVRVGHQRPVERHLGEFECLIPGRGNVAIFKVGEAKADAYTLRVTTTDPSWAVRMDVSGLTVMDEQCRKGERFEFKNAWVLLGIQVPDPTGPGRVEVAVARESCGSATKVELSLRPAQT